jgi:hypothetical protein
VVGVVLLDDLAAAGWGQSADRRGVEEWRSVRGTAGCKGCGVQVRATVRKEGWLLAYRGRAHWVEPERDKGLAASAAAAAATTAGRRGVTHARMRSLKAFWSQMVSSASITWPTVGGASKRRRRRRLIRAAAGT